MHPDSGQRLSGLPILIVEDDPPNARMLAAVFRSEGADIRVASGPDEALEILERFSARVAIVDVVLPTMSGVALARRIKSQPSTRAVVIIAVSVLNGPGLEQLALRSGCAAFIRIATTGGHLNAPDSSRFQ